MPFHVWPQTKSVLCRSDLFSKSLAAVFQVIAWPECMGSNGLGLCSKQEFWFVIMQECGCHTFLVHMPHRRLSRRGCSNM